MKNPIKKLFDDTKHLFTGDGKYQKYEPVWDATKTFFFLPSPKTGVMPFVRDNLDLKRYMSFVILALVPVTLFGIYNTGYQSGRAAGELYSVLDCFVAGAWYVLPMILVSYGQVALGISFGVVIGKEVFGGTGRNVLNPALTARAFVYFSYPVSMSGDVWIAGQHMVDGITGATALAVSGFEGQAIGSALSDAGYSLSSLFLGLVPGSVGETSALCCLLGATLLMVTRIANFRVIIGGILGLTVTSLIIALIPGGQETWANAGPLYHLCAGGFLFGISFMATDPVSAPGTNPGRWIFGFLIGFFTVVLRVANPAFMEGVMLAILFMNVFAPLLDHLVIKYNTSKRIPNV